MELESNVPELRVKCLNDAEVNPDGEYVLYWMVANRRVSWNFSLDRALDWGEELGLPVLVFEALRIDYQWASDRIHAFVIQGMIDNQAACEDKQLTYFPYLETSQGEGRGLLRGLRDRAAVVVTDDFPCFFIPRMIRGAALRAPVLFEAVDSNGLLPLRAADRTFPRAHSFRRFLQKSLLEHLSEFPLDDPVHGRELPEGATIPKEIRSQWPAAELANFSEGFDSLADFDIDHSVAVSPYAGGSEAARKQLETFIDNRLEHYADDRNHPDNDCASGLSPYLHFGHISAHEVFSAVMDHDGWTPDAVADKSTGSREGWWGASPAVESFLDELITWREVGYNFSAREDNYDKYESLPEWAQETLAEHADDEREHTYSLEQFENAETHDTIWNCAQRQLVQEGKMHNYLRMLWGKKILHWTRTPQEALDIMIELNNKYALDGRNPNSYSGIFWVLGRFDRAWGPERPIFGKIRYMTSDSTRRKLRLKQYLRTYGESE